MNLRKDLFLLGILLLPFASNAQGRWQGAYNRLGFKAGANHFNIATDGFSSEAATSWTAGFTTRSSFYNNFQYIYGISFFDFRNEIAGRKTLEESAATEVLDYKMIGVQASFLGSFKLLDHHLSVEAGPVIQVNGKMEPGEDQELWYVDNYDILATDISKVSTFNFNLAFGISGGFEVLKFWAQYQYGLNNFLKGLNDEGLQGKDSSVPEFEGRISMLTAGVVVFL